MIDVLERLHLRRIACMVRIGYNLPTNTIWLGYNPKGRGVLKGRDLMGGTIEWELLAHIVTEM